ncbi:hypothetical protein BKA62DRAFT_332044 [Auriculariales sp. MPI-PUGE-AT-0066]|nr:hypothetical protein BKA62DRAFT_332044 [Auriculariales sp. MPI-PUGE-AT-0066]
MTRSWWSLCPCEEIALTPRGTRLVSCPVGLQGQVRHGCALAHGPQSQDMGSHATLTAPAYTADIIVYVRAPAIGSAAGRIRARPDRASLLGCTLYSRRSHARLPVIVRRHADRARRARQHVRTVHRPPPPPPDQHRASTAATTDAPAFDSDANVYDGHGRRTTALIHYTNSEYLATEPGRLRLEMSMHNLQSQIASPVAPPVQTSPWSTYRDASNGGDTSGFVSPIYTEFATTPGGHGSGFASPIYNDFAAPPSFAQQGSSFVSTPVSPTPVPSAMEQSFVHQQQQQQQYVAQPPQQQQQQQQAFYAPPFGSSPHDLPGTPVSAGSGDGSPYSFDAHQFAGTDHHQHQQQNQQQQQQQQVYNVDPSGSYVQQQPPQQQQQMQYGQQQQQEYYAQPSQQQQSFDAYTSQPVAQMQVQMQPSSMATYDTAYAQVAIKDTNHQMQYDAYAQYQHMQVQNPGYGFTS